MSNTENEGPVPGGGPREGEEAQTVPNPNPDAVHPDYPQTMPGEPAPAPTAEPAREAEDSEEESGSDEN